ncbi:unnamed protein product [Schistocephalus solidus]|uniref:FERM domain-containing protein n=1 Tax=Schistocephalus solidus TaxID=70667 RepID=A0A183SR68_SCHSO|nr:unnamed protein product [Schistocephalus solidus]
MEGSFAVAVVKPGFTRLAVIGTYNGLEIYCSCILEPISHLYDLNAPHLQRLFSHQSPRALSRTPRCPGQEFFDLVVQKLQLDDIDYFDLEYEDNLGNRCWLDHFKPLYKPVSQIALRPALFSFKVKFYTPNLSLLSNRLTRRLFALQVKRDLIDGELYCGENTSALLAAFILQAELGDHEDEEERKVISHLEKMRLTKLFSPAFVSKVMDLHSNLTGMSQSEADYRLLDTARKVEFYGLKLQPAKVSYLDVMGSFARYLQSACRRVNYFRTYRLHYQLIPPP